MPTTNKQMSASEAILLALIASLPFRNPPVAYPIVIADCLFILLALVFSVEVLLGRRTFRWRPRYWLLLLYAAAFVPSLIVTPDIQASLLKLASEFYLIGLAAAASVLVDDETRLRRAVLTWLGATVVVALIAILSLIAFATGTAPWLLDYSLFGFGTLPPGPYPRLAITFLNANMACNYLTVSLGLLVVARLRAWLSERGFWLLLAGILIAAVSTISPGLGGIALLLGILGWMMLRGVGARLVLAGGTIAAGAFTVALAVTPIIHPTAPFLIHLPGGLLLAPSGRFLCWSAGLTEFSRHPIVGHGIGIDAVMVRYLDPSDYLQELTDAHNMLLNVGAQAGLFGLAAVIAITLYAFWLGRFSGPCAVTAALSATFLDAWLYQGLGGSFEDARHLWVLLGLLMAAATILPFIRVDGNNRRAGAPSRC